MTKTEAIQEAKANLATSGVTQFILRRGEQYKVFPADKPTPQGWKTAEMIAKGNVHAY